MEIDGRLHLSQANRGVECVSALTRDSGSLSSFPPFLCTFISKIPPPALVSRSRHGEHLTEEDTSWVVAAVRLMNRSEY